MDANLRNPALPSSAASASNRISIDECQRLFRLAQDEARVNRFELERLYDKGTLLLDDERYEFLWHLTQLERACRTLERCAQESFRESASLDELRDKISRLITRAVELRQTARTIVNGEQRRAEGRATRLRSGRMKASGSSQRRPALA